jgi:hypothetical protein
VVQVIGPRRPRNEQLVTGAGTMQGRAMELTLRHAARAVCLFVAVAACALLAFATALPREIVHKGSVLDPLLAAVAKALDARGMDVGSGDTSHVPLEGRPRVALLSEMRSDLGNNARRSDWEAQFESGSVGFIVAVETANPGAAKTEGEFRAEWDKAPKDRRVFLSYTSADSDKAEVVARVLHAEGYLTFTFLNEAGKSRYPVEIAGEMFRGAGHRFVVDTSNARNSRGVQFEAELSHRRDMIDARRERVSSPGKDRIDQRIEGSRDRAERAERP